MPLPARVRITHPPLPLAAGLMTQIQKKCPEAPLTQLESVTVAIAGGALIGVYLCWNNNEVKYLETSWRDRGIEEELFKNTK